MNTPAAFIHTTAEVEQTASIGDGCVVWHHSHIRSGASIGEGTTIGRGVFVDADVRIGRNCKVQNYANIYKGTVIGDRVFIGPGAMTINDKHPKATNGDGTKKTDDDWECEGVTVEDGASIGAGCIILPGVTIGKDSMVGAGSVVSKNVDGGTVLGVPAKSYIK